MAEKKNQLLKITLVIFAIVSLGYGVIYLFFPEFHIKSAGGEPIPAGWIRWFGGVLLSLGFGSIMIYRNPEKQSIFVTSLCLGSLFSGLTLLYEVIFVDLGNYNLLTTLIPSIILIILSILFWISLRQSKEILW